MWLKNTSTLNTLINVLKYSTVAKFNPSNLLSNLWKDPQNFVNPLKLLKKKHKYNEYIYTNNLEAAEIIAKNIANEIPKNSTILEFNPGMGFLTSYLLNNDNITKLLLYEHFQEFLPRFEELHSIYPDRVKVKHGDFVNLWKLDFRDKYDNGTRTQDMLEYVPKTRFEDDINMKVFGGVGNSNFIKHLINSLVFYKSIYTYGRCEMYLTIPPNLYISLTCHKEAGYSEYRALSVLFQILFEYKFICQVPKIYFLPSVFEKKTSKTKKLSTVNTDFLYVIKLVPRQNLYKLCSLDDMPALWYFIKQNFVSRKSRVIPAMEKWVPGCGPRIIVNTKKTEPVIKLHNDENETDLPQFSVPCTTMSTEDYYPSMNIYTQFGELNPSNILTLFTQFRSWPEYKESPFLASLENFLLKMEVSSDENVDGVQLVEEDNIDSPKDFDIKITS